MSLSTLTALRKFESRAATLDARLISGRVVSVQRNVKQIEGISRSDNYVRRLAGLSQDVSRKSQNTRAVRWFFATAAENNLKAVEFREFWLGVFDYCDRTSLFVPGRFWKAYDDTDAMFTKLRQAHIAGDLVAERTALVQIKQNVDAMLRISNDIGIVF